MLVHNPGACAAEGRADAGTPLAGDHRGVCGNHEPRCAGVVYTCRLSRSIQLKSAVGPLEKWDTKISLTAEDLKRFAAHYWPKAPRVERPRWIFGEVCAFAGLASTVPDLARIVAMHLGAMAGEAAGPVRGTSLLEMRESVATPFGTDQTRGVTLGWFFRDHPRWGQILYHDGEVDGHSAALWLAPQVKTAVIVLANVGGDTAPRLNQEIRTVVVGSVP